MSGEYINQDETQIVWLIVTALQHHLNNIPSTPQIASFKQTKNTSNH